MNDSALNDFWDLCLATIKEALQDEVAFQTFYKDSKLVNLDNGKATIVTDQYFNKMILTQNIELINNTINERSAQEYICEILLSSELGNNKKVEEDEFSLIKSEDNINPQFTFEKFIVGISNREAHAASLAIAMNPGVFYNPLFIYGNSGLGKTHLLNSIGNYVKDKKRELKVLFLPCADFVNDYVNAIKSNKMDDFNDRYYNIDVLLVDDIQFLAGKEKSHEVFFHLFNHFINNKKQIVLTSDRHPEDLNKLENRLVSRFASGLSVGIDSPEFETSLAILKKKIELRNVDLELISEDVLNYIASKFSSDVRRLEGALTRLLFYAISFGESGAIIDMNIALGAFKGFDNSKLSGKLSSDKIKKIVAEYYNLSTLQLVSKSRTNPIIVARHIAMYLCRDLLDLSYVKIGEEFGNRDHSTVMSAYDKVSNLMKRDDNYKKVITELTSLLKN